MKDLNQKLSVVSSISFILFASFVFAACSGTKVVTDLFSSGDGSGVEISSKPPIITDLRIEYSSYEQMVERVRQEMAVINATEDLIQRSLNRVPRGGQILVFIDREVREEANAKWFSFLLFDSFGREIHRHRGRDDISQVKTKTGGFWNVQAIDIFEPLMSNLVLRVKDHNRQEQYDFYLTRELG